MCIRDSLNNLQEGDILFVDEIHRLNRQVEEVLLSLIHIYRFYGQFHYH